MLGQWRGDADDDRVDIAQSIEIRGGLKAARRYDFGEPRIGNVLDEALAAIELCDARPVDIKADDGEFGLGTRER